MELSEWTEIVPLVSLLVKGSVLAAAALIVAALFKRRAASVRHMVCALSLTGLLLLPLLSLLSLGLPVWNVPVRAFSTSAIAVGTPTQKFAELTAPSATAPAMTAVIPDETDAMATSSVTVTTKPVNPWPLLLLAIYAVGGLVTVGALLRDYAAARGLRQVAWSAEDGPVQTVTEAARALHVRRPVAVRYGNGVGVPMTMGLFKPTILLPCDAAQWDTERLRVAVLHEVAHIRRGDFGWQMVARLACALHWCNPLVWLLARRMREEAECACDDRVLSDGIVASDYADHLVAVARGLAGQRPVPTLAVSMARQSDLGRRITALLANRMDRRGLTLQHGLTLAVAITVVLLPLAALRSRLLPQPEQEAFLTTMAAPGTVAVKTALAQKPGVFRHTLRDGTQVELVSVTRLPHQSEQPAWWKPDGMLGTGPVPYRIPPSPEEIEDMTKGKEREWEFLVKVTGPGMETRGLSCKAVTESTGWGMNTGEDYLNGKPADGRTEKARVSLRLPKDARQATFHFGISPAKWEGTSARLDMNAESGSDSGRMIGGQVMKYFSYGTAVLAQLDTSGMGNKPKLGTFRNVTYSNIPDQQIRWVADTVSGKTVEARHVSGIHGTNDILTTELFFPGLRPEQIKEMRMETRPYEWVEFASVALSPK